MNEPIVDGSPVIITPSQSGTIPAGTPFQLASSGGANPPLVQNRPPIYNGFAYPGEYLNFQVTEDWIRDRWPRISVTPGEDDLTGMRVALVSGPRPVDLHGSLTYYFDRQQQLQRIAFRGWTGEPTQLIDWLTRQFRFSEQSGGDAQRYFESSSWGRRKGFLRLDRPPVLRQDAPTEQFMVLLEILNPSSSLSISQQNRQIIEAMAGSSQ